MEAKRLKRGAKISGPTGVLDRRRFLATAGMATAACALGFPLASCNDYTITIPCLGPAAAPTPVPGMTYIRASEIGCALDCDLATGRNKNNGGDPTDDAPRINAAMAGATADHPITLIIDGSALISGLFLPAGGYWSIAGLGCGTGFFLQSGSDNDGIHNGPAHALTENDPGPPAPPRGKNVSLKNFTLNGNQGDGSNGASSTGQQRGTNALWYCGISLINLDNITIENVVIFDSPAFNMRFSNVGNVSVSGCVLESVGGFTDGLHFDGPANDITISNCTFKTGDDAIALNCPEGYSGNISRVAVNGCIFDSWTLMRLYTGGSNSAQFNIDTVTVNNCTGTFIACAFVLGYDNPGLPGAIASLTISNCQLKTSTVLGVAQDFGAIVLDTVTFTPSQSNIWVLPQANETCGFLRPCPLGVMTYSGGSVTFRNCQISRTDNINVAAVILENNSTIANVEFSGFALQDSGSFSPISELLNLGGGSVGQLVLDSLNSSSIQAPVEAGGFEKVGSVSGAGVLATSWEFPDFVMANGVPYISATTGKPSIKVDGVVEPYSPA